MLLGLGLAAPARAGTDFYTKYHVDYRFDEAGNSIVSHKVSLTNNLSRIYASQYQMTLSGEDPAGIRGRDGQGELKITTSHPQPDQTLVKVDFNEQVVGKGNTLNFTLTYSGVSAIHNGRVWEVFLPKIGNPDQIDEYDLTLTVPASFGKPAFISPQPVTSTPNGYVFSKDQVAKVGVVAAFGNFQTFSFDLGYRPGLSSR